MGHAGVNPGSLAIAMFAGLLGFACSSGEADSQVLTALAPTDADEPKPIPSASDSAATDSAEPPEDAPTVIGAPTTSDPSTNDAGPTDPSTQKPPTSSGTSQTKGCTSSVDGHTSVVKITYVDSGTALTISSMTARVTNVYDNDKNNLSVYLETTASSTAADIYDSGDILESGTTVLLTLPSNLKLHAGDSFTIKTWFDETWVPDPSASCVVQF
jgi:hypothetical protein